MRNLGLFVGSPKPEYSKPFTIVDSQKVAWTIATDRVWLFAIKGMNKGVRFRGPLEALTTILRLLKTTPKGSTLFEPSAISADLEGPGKILGVPVDLAKFRTLVSEFPEKPITLWDATETLGAPGLMMTCSDCLAILRGYDGDTSSIKDFPLTLGSTLDAFLED